MKLGKNSFFKTQYKNIFQIKKTIPVRKNYHNRISNNMKKLRFIWIGPQVNIFE